MSRPVRRGAVGKGPGDRNLASRLPDIVWDATEVIDITRRHTGNVADALADIRRAVEALVLKRDEREGGFARVVRKAMETRLGDDAEAVMKALGERGITRSLGKAAQELAGARGRFTVWSVVDALTRLSQARPGTRASGSTRTSGPPGS